MTDVTLLLGPILFHDFEIPSGINFGGGHRVAVHQLPGGQRVVDTLGRDDSQIGFAGIFSGPDATLRARSLDELRVAGVPLPLSWDVFYYTVLITEFRADYRSGTWIPYRVVCTVVQDEASSLLHTTMSLATSAVADIATAAASSVTAGLDLSQVQAAVATTGAVTRGTEAYTRARTSLTATSEAIDASIAESDTTLAEVTVGGAVSARAGEAGLRAAAQASGRLSELYVAKAYVERAAGNLIKAST